MFSLRCCKDSFDSFDYLFSSASVYVSEVVSNEWRGGFGSSLSFAMVIGLQVEL